jgi:hypothetical protein
MPAFRPTATGHGEVVSEMKTKKRASDAGKAKYQPTEQEKTALRDFYARRAAETAPRMKVLGDGNAPTISPDHPDEVVGLELLMDALGTTDADFGGGLLGQLVYAGSQGGQINESGLNFMLAVIKGIKPNDQLEAMLAAQMAAIHMATMTFARRLAHVENIPQQDSAERALNKLARTFTTQMEALKRYRTGGEQKVTVQHVSVSEGGQAIVGNVTQAGPETAPGKPADNNTRAITDARQSPMQIIDEPKRARVPLRRGQKNDGRSSA